MPPMRVDHALPRDLTEPGQERQRAIREVPVELPRRLEERVLDHIRRVHARRDPAVEPRGDHATKVLAMDVEQPLSSDRVPGARPIDQTLD